MFHCNGWCTTWAVTAIGGTHICLRAVNAAELPRTATGKIQKFQLREREWQGRESRVQG
jgi:acyl-coenzyme A synthetase/AMP-(fatty) acid ligase